jgi:hypothetical protein
MTVNDRNLLFRTTIPLQRYSPLERHCDAHAKIFRLEKCPLRRGNLLIRTTITHQNILLNGKIAASP